MNRSLRMKTVIMTLLVSACWFVFGARVAIELIVRAIEA